MSDENDDIPVSYAGIIQDPETDLRKLRDEILSMMEEDVDYSNFPATEPFKMRVTNKLHNTMLTFAALAGAAIEYYSAALIRGELIVESQRRSRDIEAVIHGQFNQHDREELLQAAGVVDPSLIGDLRSVRGARNSLVREVDARFSEFEDKSEMVHYLDFALQTVETLGDLSREAWEGY